MVRNERLFVLLLLRGKKKKKIQTTQDAVRIFKEYPLRQANTHTNTTFKMVMSKQKHKSEKKLLHFVAKYPWDGVNISHFKLPVVSTGSTHYSIYGLNTGSTHYCIYVAPISSCRTRSRHLILSNTFMAPRLVKHVHGTSSCLTHSWRPYRPVKHVHGTSSCQTRSWHLVLSNTFMAPRPVKHVHGTSSC